MTATVDSHHHFWDLERFQYDWMPTPPNVLRRRYFPEDMAPLLAETGVSSTVLVEAHSSLAEADFLLDMAEASDFVAGVVAWIDLQDPEVGAELERLKRRPSLVGIRHPVEHVVEQFGLDRLMFGSDWPACLLASDYGGVCAAALDALGPISASDKAGLMGGNAAEFYRLPPGRGGPLGCPPRW